MSGLTRLVISETCELTRAGVRYAFEREGIDVATADSAEEVGGLLADGERQLVIVGNRESEDAGISLVSALRGNGASTEKVSLLYLGDGQRRADALAAGATQFLERPAYARDVVTLARLIANRKVHTRIPTYVGDLGELCGMYYVLRALSASRWRGVLTLVRGLRRGELRFYDGEVTSAQVGVLHGLAALHQLLLWTEARIELRVEDVVRRRQIPLSQAEVLVDAARFLGEIRTAAAGMAPAGVYEQVPRKGDDLPARVTPVLRLFDGARTLADVVEDSPYRVFETLRASAKLLELGVIHETVSTSPHSAARAVLAIEEWLVGSEPVGVPPTLAREGSERLGPEPGEPASPPPEGVATEATRRARRESQPPADGAPSSASSTDWAELLPVAMASELPGYAAVVPSVKAAGEISVARERLEDVTSATDRAAMFGGGPTPEVGPVATSIPSLSQRDIDTDPIRPPIAPASDPQPAAPAEADADATVPVPLAEPEPEPESEGEREPEAQAHAVDVAAAPTRAVPASESETLKGVAPPESETAEPRDALAIAHDAAAAAVAAAQAFAASRAEAEAEAAPAEEQKAEEQKAEGPKPAQTARSRADTVETAPMERVRNLGLASGELSVSTSGEVSTPDITDHAPESGPTIQVAGELTEAGGVTSGEIGASDVAPSILTTPPAESIVVAESVADEERRAAADAEAHQRAAREAEAAQREAEEAAAAAEAEAEAARQATEAAEREEAEAAAARAAKAEAEAETEAEAEAEVEAEAARRAKAEADRLLAEEAAKKAAAAEEARRVAEQAAQRRADEEEAARRSAVQQAAAHRKVAQEQAATAVAQQTSQAVSQAFAAFTDEEEAFFRAGHKIAEQAPQPQFESFDDLETEPPKTFWQRLVSRPDRHRPGTDPGGVPTSPRPAARTGAPAAAPKPTAAPARNNSGSGKKKKKKKKKKR